MKLNRIPWIIGAAILALSLNTAVIFICLIIYKYLIYPGQINQYYQDEFRSIAPIISIITGMPILFLVCKWTVKRWESDFAVKGALLIWLVYVPIGLTILTGTGWTIRLIILAIISVMTKFVAAYYGGIAGRLKSSPPKRS
ncbi:MAG: hypothetical protein J2P41_04625 [Blastocatellia bacterium]|nr:hypothetical protein [Blastocatellia bacterium]